jgi:hypothetical protein
MFQPLVDWDLLKKYLKNEWKYRKVETFLSIKLNRIDLYLFQSMEKRHIQKKPSKVVPLILYFSIYCFRITI